MGVYRDQRNVPRRPIVVTSNFSPSEVFGANPDHIRRVRARFHIIRATRPLWLHDHTHGFPAGAELDAIALGEQADDAPDVWDE